MPHPRLRERIVAGGDFEEVARIHPKTAAHARRRSGWLGPGDTVPEFGKR